MTKRGDESFRIPRSAAPVFALFVLVAIGLALPGVRNDILRAPADRTESDMATVAVAFQRYRHDTGCWPESYRGETDRRVTFRNFPSLYENVDSLEGWNGPYLEHGVEVDGTRTVATQQEERWRGMVDAWGRPYRVLYFAPRHAGDPGSIVLLSSGPNLRYETSDENARALKPVRDDLVTVIASDVRPQ
ncbi:MAG: hypothetical protein R3E97_16490 [Candidatus Eisenbacteria bacterium]